MMANTGPASSRSNELDWEKLVTDGHVQAARVRHVQPWLVALAILFILVGIYLALIVHHAATTSSRTEAEAVPSDDAATPVRAALAGLPVLPPMNNEGSTLAPFRQIDAIVVPELLRSLDRTGQIGTPTIKVARLSAEDFWRKPWPHSGLVGLQRSDVAVVGAVANEGSVVYAAPVRWLGVFHKYKGRWDFLSASEPPFTPDPGRPSAALEQIPVTLRPVLPAQE